MADGLQVGGGVWSIKGLRTVADAWGIVMLPMERTAVPHKEF